MSDFPLIQFLENADKKITEALSKTQYQVYDIELGFEKFSVCIPIQESVAFEEQLSEFDGIDSYSLEKFVKKFDGYVQG